MASIFDEYENELGIYAEKEIVGRDLDIESEIQTEITAWNNRVETDSEVYPRLQAYWDNLDVTGWTPAGTPWSGAFISYVLRNQGFQGDGLHANYVRAVMDNKYPGWKAFGVPRNTYNSPIRVNVGDVFVKPRSGGYTSGHGDIVYRVDRENNKAYLIGGNLSDTLRTTTLDLVDRDAGFASDAISGANNPYSIVLKRHVSKKTAWLPYLAAGVAAWILLK